jgi:hypothetical protein
VPPASEEARPPEEVEAPRVPPEPARPDGSSAKGGDIKGGVAESGARSKGFAAGSYVYENRRSSSGCQVSDSAAKQEIVWGSVCLEKRVEVPDREPGRLRARPLKGLPVQPSFLKRSKVPASSPGLREPKGPLRRPLPRSTRLSIWRSIDRGTEGGNPSGEAGECVRPLGKHESRCESPGLLKLAAKGIPTLRRSTEPYAADGFPPSGQSTRRIPL